MAGQPLAGILGSELEPFLAGESLGVVYDIVLAGGDVSAVAAGAPRVTDPDKD
jgi:hypothetical protein